MKPSHLIVGAKKGDQNPNFRELKNYLIQLGFMEIPDTSSLSSLELNQLTESPEWLVFNEQTESAIRMFQRVYSLQETGTLTQETIHLLSSPRCGNPDILLVKDQSLGGLVKFVPSGSQWDKPHIRYQIQNYPSGIPKSEILSIVRRVFETWSMNCRLSFFESQGAADILIQFASGNHGDEKPFDGPGNVLAHAFYPPPAGGKFSGDVHFDDEEDWSLNLPPSGFDFWSVALHELGHSLGLAHSNNPNAVMYAYYSGARRNLHSDDIQGISSIYGGVDPKNILPESAIGQPAFTNSNDLGYLAWTGTDRNHRLNIIQTYGTRVWFNKTTLEDTSLSGPSLAFFQGKIFIAWRGVGNNQLNVMSSHDGINWGNKVILGETTSHSPSIAAVEDRLYLAWTGTDRDGKLNILNSSNGLVWTGKQTLNETSIDGPSLCALDNKLLLSWTGVDRDHRLNVVTYDHQGWRNKQTLNESSSRTPRLANINGTIFLAWTGVDSLNRLNLLKSPDGVSFYQKQTLGDTSFSSPGIGNVNGHAFILWTGKDVGNSINVLSI